MTKRIMGSAPIPEALLTLGLPTMVGMLVNALYNLADTYFMRGLGEDQMGAVTVAFRLGQIIVGLGLLFGNGAAAYLSRLLGRRDKKTADEAAQTTMCALPVGAVLNLILDPIFIYGLRPGVTGAAIATAISQAVSTAVYLCYIFRKKSAFTFHIMQCRFFGEVMSEILKIGILTLVFQILTSQSIRVINRAAKEYGSSALADMESALCLSYCFFRRFSD